MIETVSWAEFTRRFRWNQGEHVAVMAPTGAGKTTLIREILPIRKHVIFLGTKKNDKLYTQLQRDGYERVESFHEIKPWMNRVILWPKHTDSIDATVAKQRARFRTAFDGVARQGGWTVVADEAKYMAQLLKLESSLTFLQEQLRSNHGTNVSGAQRPFWLPRSVLSSATHVFLWKTTDADDLKRLADIGGINKREVAGELASLGKHEFVYIHTRGTETAMLRSQVRK